MDVPPVSLVETSVTDKNSDTWLKWLSPEPAEKKSIGEKVCLDPPRIVAFHFFINEMRDGSDKRIKVMGKLAQEYAGRIIFGWRDISRIDHWDEYRPDEYRPGMPPLIFGVDKKHNVYQMKRLVNYKNLKDFSEKLLQDQLFQAVLLAPTIEFNAQPLNYFNLVDHKDGDFLVMMYDPACYHWPILLKILLKLARLLKTEAVHVVIINKAHNYLGVTFNRFSKMVGCHGANIFDSPRPNGCYRKMRPRLESMRKYMRYIAQNSQPELINYDANGEPRAPPEDALPYIQGLFAESS